MPSLSMLSVSICLSVLVGGVLVDAASRQDRQDALHRELTQAILPQRGNAHLERLAALRALRDPMLQPLYQALCAGEDPAMQVHGVLGLGELRPTGRPDPQRLAELSDTVRAQAVAVALDQDLLAPDDVRALLSVEQLPPAIHASLLTALAHAGERLTAEDIARTAATVQDHPTAFAAQAVLAAHAGDTQPIRSLHASLAELNDAARHEALFSALETVGQAPNQAGLEFAASLLDPDMPDGLRRYAVMVLCDNDAPVAAQAFADEFDRSTRQRSRVDLALVLLMTQTAVPEGVREALSRDDLLASMGHAADALALDAPDATEKIIALADTGHRRSIAWMIDTAPRWPRDTAVAVLEHLLEMSLRDPANQQTDLAAATAAMLRQVDLDAFASRLRAAPDDGVEQTALLVALLQSPAPEVLEDVAAIRRIGLDTPDMLALLVLARDGTTLETDDVDRLVLIATGGNASNAIRTQAAWLALRHGTDVQSELSQLLRNP